MSHKKNSGIYIAPNISPYWGSSSFVRVSTYFRPASFLRSSAFFRSSSFLGRLHFWGCLHFLDRLHFLGRLHFLSRLHFLVHLYFWCHLHFWIYEVILFLRLFFEDSWVVQELLLNCSQAAIGPAPKPYPCNVNKPLNKLTGTDGRTDKPKCWEAAPPKIER